MMAKEYLIFPIYFLDMDTQSNADHLSIDMSKYLATSPFFLF